MSRTETLEFMIPQLINKITLWLNCAFINTHSFWHVNYETQHISVILSGRADTSNCHINEGLDIFQTTSHFPTKSPPEGFQRSSRMLDAGWLMAHGQEGRGARPRSRSETLGIGPRPLTSFLTMRLEPWAINHRARIKHQASIIQKSRKR